MDRFLEYLLLLCHITTGQPSRGTELLGLRHSNSVHGCHRNIFLENRLVGLVITYHKGYHILGSTKIIHRYLPQEVSKLIVHYLWLVAADWWALRVTWGKWGLGGIRFRDT